MNILLIFDKINLSFKKRVIKRIKSTEKTLADWENCGYKNNPKISVIIESHNKSLQVMHIVDKLRKYDSIEIIVVDDGSTIEHTENLALKLNLGNEFLIHANDLYENVMYDKCIRFSQSNFVILLQDDDDFDSLDWIDEALKLMEKYPDMIILGGKNGLDISFAEEGNSICTESVLNNNGKFKFVPVVNRAPMIINRKLFLEYLHNIPFSYAPFQYDDYEICLRSWLCGLKVGSYTAKFKSLSVGGMRLWNNALTKKQVHRNGLKIYNTFKTKMEEIREKVREANFKIKE